MAAARRQRRRTTCKRLSSAGTAAGALRALRELDGGGGGGGGGAVEDEEVSAEERVAEEWEEDARAAAACNRYPNKTETKRNPRHGRTRASTVRRLCAEEVGRVVYIPLYVRTRSSLRRSSIVAVLPPNRRSQNGSYDGVCDDAVHRRAQVYVYNNIIRPSFLVCVCASTVDPLDVVVIFVFGLLPLVFDRLKTCTHILIHNIIMDRYKIHIVYVCFMYRLIFLTLKQ